MTDKEETLNPAIIELIEIGNSFPSHILTGKTLEETRQNFRNYLKGAKERMLNNTHKEVE